MNKLVSKSPIQRFKQGQTIEKFYGGGGLLGKFTDWLHSGEKESQKRINQFQNEQKSILNGDTPVTGRLSRTGNGSIPDIFPKQTITKNGKSSQIRKRTIKKVSTPSPVFAGYKIGKTGGLNYSINNADKQQLIETGQFTESDFKNALTTQQALNRYFANSGLGSIKEDNAWGDQSRKALEFALSKSKGLTPFSNETTVIRTSILPTYTPSTSETGISNFTPLQRNGTFNKSQIRNLISERLGQNAYNYTGAQRRALRQYLNGESNDTSLLTNGLEKFIISNKQGGQLVSKNSIIRFKNKKK